jgi:phosphoadenosine phosphosulfate reductase
MTTQTNADNSQTDLAAEAERVGRELEDATALEILTWAHQRFGTRLTVTSSMADTVLTHLAGRVAPGIDVIFLDTGYHFAETIGTRDAVAATVPVNVISVRPELSVAEQDAKYGPKLYERNPDQCCAMRKVAPLEQALAGYDAWVTGLRRVEAPSRANTPVVGWDPRRRKVKVNPIARWSDEDVQRYATEHGVLVHPLLSEGYTSIGCEPCTRRVAEGEDARAGRWAGFQKTECGLHL